MSKSAIDHRAVYGSVIDLLWLAPCLTDGQLGMCIHSTHCRFSLLSYTGQADIQALIYNTQVEGVNLQDVVRYNMLNAKLTSAQIPY